MNIKLNSFFTFFLLIATMLSAVAEKPNWNVKTASFFQSMTITGVVNVNGTTSNQNGLVLAAFNNNICCGLTELSRVEFNNTDMAFLMIHGNLDSALITFKVYIPDLDSIIDLNNTYKFKSNAIIGGVSNPYVWSKGEASSDASMLTFSLPGQLSVSTIKEDTILLTVSSFVDLKTLTPLFQASPAAKVYRNDSIQSSGIAIVDFTGSVIFTVVSENEKVNKDYVVKILVDSTYNQKVTLSNNTVEEDCKSNRFIGVLNAEGFSTHGGCKYTLSDHYADNRSFQIRNDSLFSAVTFSIGERDVFFVIVKSQDYNDESLEATFKIQVVLNSVLPHTYINENQISIYPTLVQNNVTLDFGSIATRKSWVSVYNMKGQLIKTAVKEAGISKLNLVSKTWKKGTYVVRSTFDGKCEIHRIVKL